MAQSRVQRLIFGLSMIFAVEILLFALRYGDGAACCVSIQAMIAARSVGSLAWWRVRNLSRSAVRAASSGRFAR